MRSVFLPLALCAAMPAGADGTHGPAIDAVGAVTSPADDALRADADLLAAHVHRDGDRLTFHMTTRGTAGDETPAPMGGLGGAPVWSYVWPTTLDPAVVGFASGAGILAMAVTSHPDFDDTPLEDESGDGDPGNDGALWHSHWVVLAPTPACGPDALAVVDIPEGATPPLPETWPGLPILIDSPGHAPVFDGPEISVTAPVARAAGAGFDGVTAALRVNESVHAPLLCVTQVFDVASGDLSLPGRVD